jgi:hypothetical protein
MDEFKILTQSIGEFAVTTVGTENLKGLQLTMRPDDHTGHIAVALVDESDEAQKSVLRSLLEVEQVFFDEAVLSFSFVDHIDRDVDEPETAALFSYA